MKLTQEQKNELYAYFENNKDDFEEFTFDDIKKIREEARAEYLANKKLIDKVFYNEISYA